MMLSLATSLLVLVSIPFLIVVDHKAGAGYTELPTSERTRRDSNVLHQTRKTTTKYKASTIPRPEISKPPLPLVQASPQPPSLYHLTNRDLAGEEEQSGDSTEASSLLSGPGDILDADRDDAASRKSSHSQCIDVTGLALLYKPDFWQLWVLMGLLSGVGLMTIKYVLHIPYHTYIIN